MLKKVVFFLFCYLLTNVAFTDSVTITPQELTVTKNAPTVTISQDKLDQDFSRPDFHHTFFKMLALLGVIIVLSIISLWSFKRLTKNRLEIINSKNSIKVLEKRVLSPKSILYLVEYEGKKALVSESHLDMKIKFLEN